MAIHNDGDTCVGDACIGATLIDAEASDDRRAAVEVANLDEEHVYLEISTANRSELLIVPRADATALAARIWQAAQGVDYPPL